MRGLARIVRRSALEIKRDIYLNELIRKCGNGFIKIITGLRRCGKSDLLRALFRRHLRSFGVPFERVKHATLTATTRNRYIALLEDACLLGTAKRYVITANTSATFCNQEGILTMNIFDVRLNSDRLDF